MATSRDWSLMDWSPTLSFALQNERQLAQSSLADAGKGAEYKFAPTPENAALLQALGYGGQGLTDVAGSDYGFGAQPVWSDDARTWLANNGYNVGVAHDPGSSAGGRAEYFGLTGPNGQFVQGQGDPTMTMSDTMMDQIIPFAMMAGPFLSAAGAIGGAAEAGAAGGLSGAADGVSALGSAWSPQALGLTGGITPGVTAAEIAGLSLPELGAGLGAAGGIGTLGGGGGGVTSLGSAWSPEALGLSGGITPGATAADFASLSQALPGAVAAPTASVGGTGGMSSADKAAMYGNEGYGTGMSGAQTSAYDGILNATGSKGLADVVANSSLGSGLLDGIKGVSDMVGGASNLGGLLGAIGGAASSQSGTQTTSRDPWSAAQPFLKGLLGDADAMRANLQQNPFTPQQTQQYGNAYAGLDQARAALPGLLGWGQQAMQRQNTVPSYADLFSQVKPK